MKTISLLVVLLFISVGRADQSSSHVLHGLFYKPADDANVYYGSLDLDDSQLTVINTLSVDQIGNPKNRKYSILPLAFDPVNDLLFIAAPNAENRVILSVINATTGAFLQAFLPAFVSIISLQFDIFHGELFAHVETEMVNHTQVIEVYPNNGTIKRVLATLDNARGTDIASYCPICRKYFLMVEQNNQFVYVGVDTTDAGGISWQSAMNFDPVSIRFDYKTFVMYAAYINQTDQVSSMIGIVNRTLGGISEVRATISTDPNLFVTAFSAFDIEQNIYYTSNVFSWPYSLGVSYVNVNTSQTTISALTNIPFHSYVWFVRQFIQ